MLVEKKKFYTLLLLNVLALGVLAQRPMSYEELLPKIDSVKNEADRLSHIYEVNEFLLADQKKSDKETHNDLFIYSRRDSVFGLFIDSNQRTVAEYLFIYPNSTPTQSYHKARKLSEVEDKLYSSKQLLLDELTRISDSLEWQNKQPYYLFMNDDSFAKLYSFFQPSNSNNIPVHNNLLLMKKHNNEIISTKIYRNSDKKFEIINQKGDTTQGLTLICDSQDKYLYPVDIFLFKTFRPKWWITEFKGYSRLNRRSFIYNVEEDEVHILKFPIEK